jgi:ELAV like protein 2/3/4
MTHSEEVAPISEAEALTVIQSSEEYNRGNNNLNTNLFINYLPQEITDETLRNMFLPFGDIESCKVMLDLTTGQSRCFGFVKFGTSEQAQFAANAMNGHKLKNKTLVVKPANATNQSSVGTPSNNVYIKGIPQVMTTEQLQSLFSPYGTIAECKILLDPVSHFSRGMGFVRFNSPNEADNSIKALNNYVLAGTVKPIIVKYADTEEERRTRQQKRRQLRYSPYGIVTPLYPPQVPQYGTTPTYLPMPGHNLPAPMGQEANLFIYHLPPDTDDAYLYRLFGPYGAIESVKVIRDPTTIVCKGYGFVKMMNWIDAWNAIQSLNGYRVGDKYLQVSFKKNS